MTLETLGWDDAWASLAIEHGHGHGLTPARVIESQRSLVTIDTGAHTLLAAPGGRLRHAALAASDLPTVGDWVLADVRPGDDRATVHTVLPRRTKLSRRAPGDTESEQLFAANVDVVFVVTSMNRDLNPRRIERALVQAREGGAAPIVVLTKADLCDDPDAAVDTVRGVTRDAPVCVVRALEGQGLAPLRDALHGAKTAVLLGSSGVGKSTLLNALLERDAQSTAAVRAHDDRGRHTTTSRHLLEVPDGGLVIDTPGIRELQLWDAGESLTATFDDVAALAARCRFRDCGHGAEPGCAVREALSSGALDPARYESHQKLAREAAFQARRGDKAAESAEKRRWISIHKNAQARADFRRRNG